MAWTTQRRLKIKYQSLESEQAKEWVLDPYFVDMTGVGNSVYVIGHAVRQGKEGIITFKMERIKGTELLPQRFEIPCNLNIPQLLLGSWGIFIGELVGITLKFTPRVSRRVKESTWHPSQVIEDMADGGCLLRMRINSTVEITPWIRSWGPDVEVIEPEALRREFKRWAAELSSIYR